MLGNFGKGKSIEDVLRQHNEKKDFIEIETLVVSLHVVVMVVKIVWVDRMMKAFLESWMKFSKSFWQPMALFFW